MAEEQIRQARAESGSLRRQLQAQASQAGPQVAPPTASIWSTTADLPSEMKQSKSSQASVLFLQWQNAHLQAEIRHYQQALTNTKSELQRLGLNFQYHS
ncbi:unnamed protein product [Symbiodinium natans]|uniref:Uncharacterized protein n=1 Tax=Symbiodinium natans TaxID=878477 RepID=A0A812LAI2_9DINO|nr:unnamed protein product [Symbiodinium natans]